MSFDQFPDRFCDGDADGRNHVIDGLDDGRNPHLILTETADRLTCLADTAELMGDIDSAINWRSQANELRLRAMTDWDD